MKILTAEQMREIDRRAIESYGIPSIVLMENAATAVVEATLKHFPSIERVAIVCGPGQNGGDGYAVARHMENRGVVPVVIAAGGRGAVAGDARTNLEVCERLALPIYDVTTEEEVDRALARLTDVDVVIDAIFGTGLSRPPEGIFASLIDGLNDLWVPVVSIDLPSGLSGSTGIVGDRVVRAALTVTFAQPKIAHLFAPASEWCGEVIVADIGIPHAAVDAENVRLALITADDVRHVVAPRDPSSHKGTHGHLAIVGGSEGRSGAAALAARGALRGGAGLVTILTDAATAAIIDATLMESMTRAIDRSDGGAVAAIASRSDAAVVGPGLSDDDDGWDFVRALLPEISVPTVVDASALNAFEGAIARLHPGKHARIITPHPGELARLLGSDAAAINRDRIGSAVEAASKSGCIVVLKGHQTVVADPEGNVMVNPTGNAGMATGGMGDVLSGVAGVFLAQHHDPFTAACAAAYLHGMAGDLLFDEMGDIGMLASEVADRLPAAIARVREDS